MDIGWKEFKDRASSGHQTEEEDQPPLNEQESERTSASTSGLIDEEAKNFLTEILQRPQDWDATEPSEIARLRLIAASVSRSGNDDTHLGTHDANLVFRHYRDATLSDQEFTALIDCGVAGFGHQNVPLWRWVSKADMGQDYLYRIRILATMGSGTEQVGAIKVLQSLDSSLPTHGSYFNKARVLKNWLSTSAETSVLDAVVSFLATNGSEEDIPLIEEASGELPPYKKSKVETAIVEMILRRSAEDALKRICERDVSSVGIDLALRILANPQSLVTETLKECLSAKPDAIRVGVAKILYERGEIDEGAADSLLTDDNAEIRLVAAEVLHSVGRELEDDVLEKALKVEKSAGFGRFGSSTNGHDKKQLEIYRANRRSEIEVSKLIDLAENDVIQYKCLQTLFQRSGGKLQDRIRQGLDDHFSAYFQKSTAKFRDDFASDEKALKLLDQVLPSYRRELCNSAAQALCQLRKPEDLARIRLCVDTLGLEADKDILQFLGRFGDWQDVERILKLGRDEDEPRSMLAIPIVSLAKERAAAHMSVGKSRVADLLALELDASIRTAILKQIPKSTFVTLSDDLVLRELAHPNAECRAIVALRCVQAFSKVRVTALLNDYVDSQDHHFYNSIHWLDLGVSISSKLSRSVAGRELDRR